MLLRALLLVPGWGLLFLSPLLRVYVTMLAAGFHVRIVRNEEPWLASRFGESWDLYRRDVPRWRPRLTPWREA